MSGDTPDGNGVEVPQGSPIEAGQAQPVVPEVPVVATPSEVLADEIAAAPDPISAIRAGADDDALANLTLTQDLSPDAQSMADVASEQFDKNLVRAADGQGSSTQPSDEDYGGAYTEVAKKANSRDRKTRQFEPDDSLDVPVSDKERADGFRDAAEAHGSSEASNEDIADEAPVELTDEQFIEQFQGEKDYLDTIEPGDPMYADAQRRIRSIDAFTRFLNSGQESLGNMPRETAIAKMRTALEQKAIPIPGKEDASSTPVEAPAQESNPANSAEQPISVEPISDDQLAEELAYLKAESGHDKSHPYASRINNINSFRRIQALDKTTIRGVPKDEALRQMREELTKGAVEVPRPEPPTVEVVSGNDTQSSEHPLSDSNAVEASTGNAELDRLRDHLRNLTSEGEPTGIGPESDANYTREQIAKLEASVASDGAKGEAEPAVAEEPAAENPAAGEVSPPVDGKAEPAEVDPETQRRIEMGELRQKVEAMRDSLIQGKEEGEELSPIESAKLNALNIDLGILSLQIESGRISDSQIRIMSSKVESYMQADSKEEIDAIRFPGGFESTLQAEAKKLTEQAKSEPDNAAIADRLKKIDEFKNLPWFSGTPEQVQLQMALRKELLIPFDTGASGDAPEGVEVPLPTGPGTSVEVDDDKAQELAREKDALVARIQDKVSRLRDYDENESDEQFHLNLAKRDELQSELDFLAHITRDGNFHEDDLRTSSQRADLYTQAESMAEIDAIRYPGDFEKTLEVEANRLAQKLQSDPDNAALADRLRKIDDFTARPMYPHDPELVREQAALRKELVIPFDGDTLAEVDSDDDEEEFMPMVTVPRAKRQSLLHLAKAGFNAGLERYRAKRRAKNAGEPAAADSGPLPPWLTTEPSASETPPLRWRRPAGPEPARDASIDLPAPTVRVGSRDMADPTPASEPPVAPPAVEDEPPAAEPAPVEPLPVEPVPAPRANSEQKLASMNLDNRLPLSKARADEALKLLQDRRDALRIDRIPAGERTAAEAARLKHLDREFPDALAADRKAREQAVTPVYSAEQSELKRLQDLHEDGNITLDELGRLDELETAESRYKLLSEKEKLTASEQKELDEMGDTWKDPALRAKEQEILDLADVSLESSADFAKFAEALQEYALRKQGKFHPALEAGIRMAVQEYFNRPDSGLTIPERNAMEQIQKLVKGMQQEIATLMTYKKSIEAQFDKQKEIVEQIKVSNKLVGGDMRSDDRTKQEEAHRLTQLYLQLASTNSVIRITKRRAEDANYNFQWRHRKVRKELGVQSLKDTMLGTWDDINRVFRFASRNFGVETDPVLSVRNKKLERP